MVVAAIMEIAIRPSPLLMHANTMVAGGITKAAIASIRNPHVFERAALPPFSFYRDPAHT